MENFWIIVAVIIFVRIFSIRDFLRTKRHASRNAIGRCGMCAEALGGSRIRQVSYRYARMAPPVTVNVCQRCFTRRRVRGALIWLLVLVIAGVICGLPVLYPQ